MPVTRSMRPQDLRVTLARGPFRFLDLPFDLRVAIYKFVCAGSIIYVRPSAHGCTAASTVLDQTAFPSALAKTCHTIRDEYLIMLVQSSSLVVEFGLVQGMRKILPDHIASHIEHLTYTIPGYYHDNDTRQLEWHLIRPCLPSLKKLELWYIVPGLYPLDNTLSALSFDSDVKNANDIVAQRLCQVNFNYGHEFPTVLEDPYLNMTLKRYFIENLNSPQPYPHLPASLVENCLLLTMDVRSKTATSLSLVRSRLPMNCYAGNPVGCEGRHFRECVAGATLGITLWRKTDTT